MRIDRYILVLPALLAVLVACQRQPEPEVAVGDTISFIASTAAFPAGEPDTRTVYSGEVINGRERIEWVEYDRFQVYCPESGGVNSAFYYVEGETHEAGSVESHSTGLILVGNGDYDALKWSFEPTYHFYGRYPAHYESSYDNDDQSPEQAEFRSQNLASSTFTCVMPAFQYMTQDGDSNTWLPDTRYAYMTAYATASRGDTDIILPFTPVYNAFEITIPNDYPDGDFVVAAVVLEASARRLNGTYKVGIASSPVPSVPASADEDDRWVGGYFYPEAAVVSPGANNALRFTVFSCPVAVAGTDEDHLSVFIYFSDGNFRMLPLKNADGSWVSCTPFSKTRVTCTSVPSPQGTNYGMVLSSKNLEIDSGSSSGTVTVVSFSSVNTQPAPTPWTVEYSADGTTWSSTAPASGVYASPSSGNGNLSGETVTINKTSGYSGTYYVRFKNTGAYEILTVTVAGSNDNPQGSGEGTGTIHGFSINSQGGKVAISKGNLQYIGSAATPYWKFADHQWDYFGNNGQASVIHTNVNRDLFGWGTGDAPNQVSINADYSTFSDWGTNTIVNGDGYTWRTLTFSEWYYLVGRKDSNNNLLHIGATVNGIHGIILFPDDYSLDTSSFSREGSFTDYIVDETGWSVLESSGCVFLPAAGELRIVDMEGQGVDYVGVRGKYWSSTEYADGVAYTLYFQGAVITVATYFNKQHGYSVRLVRDLNQ